MAGKAYAKEGVGYSVKQYGATCMGCRKKMGKGTRGIGVRRGMSFFYYHPVCYKKRAKDKR